VRAHEGREREELQSQRVVRLLVEVLAADVSLQQASPAGWRSSWPAGLGPEKQKTSRAEWQTVMRGT